MRAYSNQNMNVIGHAVYLDHFMFIFAEYILRIRQREPQLLPELREAIKLIQSFLQGRSTEIVDYELLADEWIIILQPYTSMQSMNRSRKSARSNITSIA
jgi:hypothetical protein